MWAAATNSNLLFLSYFLIDTRESRPLAFYGLDESTGTEFAPIAAKFAFGDLGRSRSGLRR